MFRKNGPSSLTNIFHFNQLVSEMFILNGSSCLILCVCIVEHRKPNYMLDLSMCWTSANKYAHHCHMKVQDWVLLQYRFNCIIKWGKNNYNVVRIIFLISEHVLRL